MKPSLLISLLSLLRPHQWIKNILVFAPLFFSEHWNSALLIRTLYAFAAFSAISSSAYCLNDIIDFSADCQHPKKKHRPVASGQISPYIAGLLSIILLLISIAISHQVSAPLLNLILIYAGLQAIYSNLIKNMPILDILLLSSLFVLRLLGGAAVTNIQPSPWIITCTWLISLMLAIGKRLAEISALGKQVNVTRPVLLKYSVQHLRSLFTSIGSITIVCYLLWCNETVSKNRFQAAEIYPSVILVSFAILRYQLLVFQRKFQEDPIKGLLKDLPIVTSVCLFVAYIGLIIYLLR